MPYTETNYTWDIEDVITAGLLNQYVRDQEEALRRMQLFACKVYLTGSGLAVSNNTKAQVISWQASAWNDGATWTSGSDPDRLHATVAGYYQLAVNLKWVNSGSGRRGVSWVRSGASSVNNDMRVQQSAGLDICSASDVIWLQAGEYIRIHPYQSSGGNLDLTGGTEQATWASFRLIGTGTGEPVKWRSPRTWINDERITAWMLNDQIRDPITNLRYLKGTGVSLYLAEDFSTSNDSRDPISWGTKLWGVGDMWESGSQIRAPVTGVYLLQAVVEYDDDALTSGVRGLGYIRNGTSTDHDLAFQSSSAVNINVAGADLIDLNADDFIEVYGYHDTGESLTMNGVTSDKTRMSLILLAATQ